MIINDNFINVTEYTPTNNDKNATIIFTHGLAEYSKSYIEIANFFKDNGFNVITFDIQGHGKSHGKRGYIKSYNDYINDLHEIVLYAKRNTEKVFLVGHSMGGVITNIYVSRHNNVTGVVISSSPTDYLDRIKSFRYVPKVLINNKKLKTSFNDPKLSGEKYVKDAFDLDFVYVRITTEVLIKGIKEFKENANKLITPALYLYSKKDVMVNYENGSKGLSMISSKDKELILYENSNHNIFNDVEKEKIFTDMLNWFNKRI